VGPNPDLNPNQVRKMVPKLVQLAVLLRPSRAPFLWFLQAWCFLFTFLSLHRPQWTHKGWNRLSPVWRRQRIIVKLQAVA
jgi:hypothetical protein